MKPVHPLFAAIIVAAGRGERAGLAMPKQFASLEGRSVLALSVEALALVPEVVIIQCVIGAPDRERYEAAMGGLAARLGDRLAPPAIGGATRQASVLAGLEALAPRSPQWVLIHDAARPFVAPALIKRVMAQAVQSGAAIPGLAITDTIKEIDASGIVVATPPRARLRAAQTPQGFSFGALFEAHRRAWAEGVSDLTDDAAIAEWAGLAVSVVEGDPANRKLTNPADFAARQAMETRVGFGYDVHAFGEGQAVMLAGIVIPHERGLIGHSDADVGLHALTDAILGALAEGDIGHHFPPGDSRWKGAASDRFLAFAVERVKARGGRLDHCDLTFICEAPRIGPYRDAMRDRIAAICGVPLHRVAVKATTSERLGFTGRGEGIAAQAVATVSLPVDNAGTA